MDYRKEVCTCDMKDRTLVEEKTRGLVKYCQDWNLQIETKVIALGKNQLSDSIMT